MEHSLIAGRVVDATSGKPIAGAHVTIIRVVETPQGVFGEQSRHLLTDASGEFVFAQRIPGRHRIDVEKSGFAPSFDPFNATLFDLDAGQSINDVQISLKRGGVVSGGVRDAGGEPQAEMTVSAMRLIPPRHKSGLDMIQGGVAHTNDLGEFRIANLPEGEYLVIASERLRMHFDLSVSAGAAVAAPTYYPGTTERRAAQVISIRAGETVRDVWFSTISTPAFTVSGTVVDETGAPLGGAMVTLFPGSLLETPSSPLMGRADSDGVFQIGAVIPGTYHVNASAPMGPSGGGAFFDLIQETVRVDSREGGDSVVFDPPSSRTTKVTVENDDVTGLRVVASSPR